MHIFPQMPLYLEIWVLGLYSDIQLYPSFHNQRALPLYIMVAHWSKKSEPMYILLSNLQFSGIITSGTKCKLSTECGLVRGNLQWSGVLDWFSQSKHFDPIVVVDWLMHYAAKPFGASGRTDDAWIDRNLNSWLIAHFVSSIQILSEIFSFNLIFGHLSMYKCFNKIKN